MAVRRIPERPDDAVLSQREVGICSTCTHFNACTLREQRTGPTHYCEEFACESGTQMHAASRQESLRDETPESWLTEADRRYLGLCANCDHRSTCTLAATEGGIWHCEEYR